MLASTSRKLSARGLAISRLVPEMPTSALGATATVRAGGVAQHDVAQAQRRAALLVALELGAADLDAIAAAEVLLDRRGQPGRREIEHDRSAGRAATTARRRRPARTTTTAPSTSVGRAHHRMPAVEHEPGIERQPPAAGMPQGRHERASLRAARRPSATSARATRAGVAPACADAPRAPPPVPGAPRCADCYPCPSCPIGRPLVRRFSDWPFTGHTLPANRFSWRHTGFAQNPVAAATAPHPMPNSA